MPDRPGEREQEAPMPANRTMISSALKSLPSVAAREALVPTIEDAKFRGVIPHLEANRMAEQAHMTMAELMLALVPFAQAYAQPAISDYFVGAVAQGATTQSLYFGANMEFAGAALSFTTHAEQSATTNAWLNGEQGLIRLAVSAAPCGYCRQFLHEVSTAAKLVVLLTEGSSGLLTSFLPDAFGPGNLGVTAALMSQEAHGLMLDASSQDPLILSALAAANACYAPYTKSYAAVAVGTRSGAIYDGRLAETAAYSPSMSPLESALVMWNFGDRDVDRVGRVALVQINGAVADQTSATAALVASLARSGHVDFGVYGAHLA
jgi:cytidine deaminase